MTQVQLGANGGTVGWTAAASCGGFPSVVEDSLICATPGQYYAINRTTGAINNFHSGDVSGGGFSTPAYDPARKQFYILESYSSSLPNALTAYRYNSDGSISQLWQRSGAGINSAGGLAIDASGNIYTASGSTILKL